MSVEERMSRRQLLRKVAALGVGLAFAGPILAACGPTPTPKVVKEVVKETVVIEKPVTKIVEKEKVVEKLVTVAPAVREAVVVRWHAHSGSYGDWSAKRAEVFNKSQDKITVKVEAFPADGYKAKLVSMHATKLIGDAFWLDTGVWLDEWSYLGITRPVDDFVKAEGFDLSVYYPGNIESCKFQDKLMALPLHGHGLQTIMMYNQDMLDKIGVKYPEVMNNWSLDELIEVAKKLTVVKEGKTERFGWCSLTGHYPILFWVRIFGGEYITKDGKKALLDTPEAKAAFQWLVDSMHKHKVAPLPTQIETSYWAMFAAEKTAMTQAGASYPPSVREVVRDKFRWATVTMPPGPPPKSRRAAMTFCHSGSISTVSKHPEATWQFLKFMTNHESGVDKVLSAAGAPGARPDCYEDPEVLKAAPEFEAVGLTMAYAWPPHLPANFRGTEMQKIIDQELADIWLNKVNVEEGAKKVNKALQEVLDKPAA